MIKNRVTMIFLVICIVPKDNLLTSRRVPNLHFFDVVWNVQFLSSFFKNVYFASFLASTSSMKYFFTWITWKTCHIWGKMRKNLMILWISIIYVFKYQPACTFLHTVLGGIMTFFYQSFNKKHHFQNTSNL